MGGAVRRGEIEVDRGEGGRRQSSRRQLQQHFHQASLPLCSEPKHFILFKETYGDLTPFLFPFSNLYWMMEI